ncbi:MAG: MATE family efflux transporter [Acutalibacter sp.]
MAAENNLGKDKVSRLVWRIAIPSMLGQFVSVLYSIVDRMYIGNIPEIGDVALAGVGVCGPVVTMVGSVAVLVGVGGAPLVSIRMGEEDLSAAKKVLANCFLMLIVFSVLLIGGFSLPGAMLRLFGASDATIPSPRSTSPPTCAAPFSPWRPAG